LLYGLPRYVAVVGIHLHRDKRFWYLHKQNAFAWTLIIAYVEVLKGKGNGKEEYSVWCLVLALLFINN